MGTGPILTNSLSHLPLSLDSLTGYMFTTHTYAVPVGPFPGGNFGVEFDLIGVNASIDSINVDVQKSPEPAAMTMGLIGAIGGFFLLRSSGAFRRRAFAAPGAV
jgi:hypothetical protein